MHLAFLFCCLLLPATTQTTIDRRFETGELIASDDFLHGLSDWSVELESGGKVETRDGALDIDVPAGCTVWFKPALSGPLMIEYEATLISAGGTNDRVSDLNCFWMARDSRSHDDLFATKRSGKFREYDQLFTYYVGLGGNDNTTTRFRRYIGKQDDRPLLPEHDLRDRNVLNLPNIPRRIRAVACGSLIQFYCDDRKLFELNDPQPYIEGHFAFRTVKNHMRIRQFRVYRLMPREK